MAAKKKAKKKPAKADAPRKKTQASPKGAARKKSTKKPATKKRGAVQARQGRTGNRPRTSVQRRLPGSAARSGGQSGDLQGLSDAAGADSESVDELLEEGNALEAEAVEGVEDADDSDGREGRTKEVPEDDVPEEYLDNEQ